jgi:protein SCO1/2
MALCDWCEGLYIQDSSNQLLATAMEDRSVPDGFIHSGTFILIDKKGRIRGKHDGTMEKDVDRLITDIERLHKWKN